MIKIIWFLTLRIFSELAENLKLLFFFSFVVALLCLRSALNNYQSASIYGPPSNQKLTHEYSVSLRHVNPINQQTLLAAASYGSFLSLHQMRLHKP